MYLVTQLLLCMVLLRTIGHSCESHDQAILRRYRGTATILRAILGSLIYKVPRNIKRFYNVHEEFEVPTV